MAGNKGCCGGLSVPPGINTNFLGCTCDVCRQNCGESPSPSGCDRVTNIDLTPTIEITSAWNVPFCQGVTNVYIDPATPVSVGAFLWSPTVGYFEIVNIGSKPGQLTIQNLCLSNIANIGASVPSCSKFLLVANPLPVNAFGSVFLTTDFTAPSDGDCTVIGVSSTDGFIAGMIVLVGAGFYYISAVNPSGLTLTICNFGSGYPAGTNLIATDSFGRFIYQVAPAASTLNFSMSRSAENLAVSLGTSSNNPGFATVEIPEETIINPFPREILVFGNAFGDTNAEGTGTIGSPDTFEGSYTVVTDFMVTPSVGTPVTGIERLAFRKMLLIVNPAVIIGRSVRAACQFRIPPGESVSIKASHTFSITADSYAFAGTMSVDVKVGLNLIGVFA